MIPKTMSMDLAGREFKISNDPIYTYASGSAVVSLGDTLVLGNATIATSAREGDFFPLVVDYEENMYAAGRISGSRFVKRSGRPSEKSILTSRLIDRPIRPLFPKKTRNEIQVICSTLSVDLEVDPATTAINAASIALMLSGAPFEGPIGAIRMGYVDGQLIVNPTYKQTEEGQLNLVVAGTLDAITMVEAATKEVSEDLILEALQMAHKYIKEICEFQLKYAEGMNPEPIALIMAKENEEAIAAVKAVITQEMLDGIRGNTKPEIKAKFHELEGVLEEKYKQEIEDGLYNKGYLFEILNEMFEKNLRKIILEKGERIDGRKTNEVREIKIELDLLPRTHGSAMFHRGETTALTITTLGGPGAAQIVDTMEADTTKSYFHHYHFPPYSVGEIKPLRGPGRREIGHGDLAERALLPVLPDKAVFPYTMWVMTEIMRCNGSTSMASVCGSSLSLMAAGVPIKRPVSGIAMGLVADKQDPSKYVILSDIQSFEDFAGDMDFKVTGTSEGITALQMDIKIKGLSVDLLRNALNQAKEGRIFILNEMAKVLPAPRTKLSEYAPLILNLQINPDLIKVVIGKGGEMINKIIDECGVEIDIDDTGIVNITAPDQEAGNKAIEWIKRITYMPKAGDVFDGKVVKIMDFGAFVEFMPGKDGMVHISKLSKQRVNKVEDVVKLGDSIKVKLVEVDSQGRYNLAKVLDDNEGGSKPSNPSSNNEPKKPEVEHTDSTLLPEAKDRDAWKERGDRVEGTKAVRKVNGN